MTREPLSIRKLSPNSGSYYLMQGQDKLAIIVPLSDHVYGPDILSDLLTAMCELTNDAQDEILERVCKHLNQARYVLSNALEVRQCLDCKALVDPPSVTAVCPDCDWMDIPMPTSEHAAEMLRNHKLECSGIPGVHP